MTNIHSRLLLAERDSLLPMLRRTPEAAFDLPTVCTQWSVRDVIAHCASALVRVVTGTEHSFSPADNQVDVDERKGWPLSELLAELERAYALAAAAPSVARVAFGEWVHGGDIREALGEPDAYASAGVEDALVILSGTPHGWASRRPMCTSATGPRWVCCGSATRAPARSGSCAPRPPACSAWWPTGDQSVPSTSSWESPSRTCASSPDREERSHAAS
jgi:uncharacterized protein (TIGR03083 family)